MKAIEAFALLEAASPDQQWAVSALLFESFMEANDHDEARRFTALIEESNTKLEALLAEMPK